ncbi:hypothetical protein SDC9_174946 [bioreactor metagenome]|uniref:Uncharacterized protein n=1 Tax=bioreactor metagenome TaxID=1076179 RepID=A0A645GNN8_9ZZZZ
MHEQQWNGFSVYAEHRAAVAGNPRGGQPWCHFGSHRPYAGTVLEQYGVFLKPGDSFAGHCHRTFEGGAAHRAGELDPVQLFRAFDEHAYAAFGRFPPCAGNCRCNREILGQQDDRAGFSGIGECLCGIGSHLERQFVLSAEFGEVAAVGTDQNQVPIHRRSPFYGVRIKASSEILTRAAPGRGRWAPNTVMPRFAARV